MAILAEEVDGVIGVDTHRDTLAAAAVSPIGAVLASTDSPANARGYRRLLDFAREHVPGRRCWALEGVGSYGAGLAAFLDQAGERVVEVYRLNRSGDRQLNRALHTITLIRMRLDPATKAYVARRITEGKTARDAQRCLKRVICHQLFKTLERIDRPTLRSIVDLVQAA
ncbi:transposase [Streptomyces sp. NPDC056227]|uniref:IS110 family transposase n=1 Tax=Streptomyces sp. NPDC056227 TaxID=3345753 RepID=UPI0035DDAE16